MLALIRVDFGFRYHGKRRNDVNLRLEKDNPQLGRLTQQITTYKKRSGGLANIKFHRLYTSKICFHKKKSANVSRLAKFGRTVILETGYEVI